MATKKKAAATEQPQWDGARWILPSEHGLMLQDNQDGVSELVKDPKGIDPTDGKEYNGSHWQDKAE